MLEFPLIICVCDLVFSVLTDGLALLGWCSTAVEMESDETLRAEGNVDRFADVIWAFEVDLFADVIGAFVADSFADVIEAFAVGLRCELLFGAGTVTEDCETGTEFFVETGARPCDATGAC